MKILCIVTLATAMVSTLAFPTPAENLEIDSSSGEQIAEIPIIKRVTKVEPVKQLEENNEPIEKVEDITEVKAVPVASKVPALLQDAEVEEKPSEILKTVEVSDEVKKADVIPKRTVQAVLKKTETTPEVVKEAEMAPIAQNVDQVEDIAVTKIASENAPKVDSNVEQPFKGKVKVDPSQTDEAQSAKLDTKKETKVQASLDSASSSEQAADDASEETIKEVPIVSFNEALEKYQKTHEAETDLKEKVKPSSELKKEGEIVADDKDETIAESLTKDKMKAEAETVYKKIPVAVVQDDIKKEDLKTVTNPVKVESDETSKIDLTEQAQVIKTAELESEKPSIVAAVPSFIVEIRDAPKHTKDEPLKDDKTVESEMVKPVIADAVPAAMLTEIKESAKITKDEASEDDSIGQPQVFKTVEPEEVKPIVLVVVPSAVETSDSVKPANDDTKLFIVEAMSADKVEDSPKPVEPVAILESEPMIKTKVEVQADEKIDPSTSETAAEKVEPATISTHKVVKENHVKVVEVVKDEPAVESHGSSIKTTTKDEIVKKGAEDKGDGDSSAAKASEELKKVDEEKEISDTSAGESAPAPAKLDSKSKGKKKLPANIRGYRKRLQQERA